MRNYEDSHNYMREKKNFHRYVTDKSEESLKRDNERNISNELKYGKFPSLIIAGENDRINGENPQVIDDEAMRTSYLYGYFEKGSRTLEGKFAKGIYSLEEQRNFGIIDLINKVPEEYIKNLKQYRSYMEGRIYQMGRASYDYITDNNMSFEEYVYLMGIMYPEVTTIPFKEGYDSREKEINNKYKK